MFDLATLGVDLLAEIAGAGDQSHPHHGQVEVGGRAQGVARQHAQTAAVGGDVVGEPDLHGEVGDPGLRQKVFETRGGGHLRSAGCSVTLQITARR